MIAAAVYIMKYVTWKVSIYENPFEIFVVIFTDFIKVTWCCECTEREFAVLVLIIMPWHTMTSENKQTVEM